MMQDQRLIFGVNGMLICKISDNINQEEDFIEASKEVHLMVKVELPNLYFLVNIS